MNEKKEGEGDSGAGKEEKEKETGDGDNGKEKDAEDLSKGKEEKDKTSDGERDTPAVKGEGSEGKTDSEEDKSKGEMNNTVTLFSQPPFSVILNVFSDFSGGWQRRKDGHHLGCRGKERFIRQVHTHTLHLSSFQCSRQSFTYAIGIITFLSACFYN